MALLCLHGAFMVSQVGQSLTGRFVERYFHTLFGLPPSRGKDVGKTNYQRGLKCVFILSLSVFSLAKRYF